MKYICSDAVLTDIDMCIYPLQCCPGSLQLFNMCLGSFAQEMVDFPDVVSGKAKGWGLQPVFCYAKTVL